MTTPPLPPDVGPRPTGPSPRGTLAAERTALAWRRSALALLAGSVAAGRLLSVPWGPGGWAVTAVGAVLAVVMLHAARRRLTASRLAAPVRARPWSGRRPPRGAAPPPGGRLVTACAATLVLLGGAAVVVVLTWPS